MQRCWCAQRQGVLSAGRRRRWPGLSQGAKQVESKQCVTPWVANQEQSPTTPQDRKALAPTGRLTDPTRMVAIAEDDEVLRAANEAAETAVALGGSQLRHFLPDKRSHLVFRHLADLLQQPGRGRLAREPG
jgi:hypothetical protein